MEARYAMSNGDQVPNTPEIVCLFDRPVVKNGRSLSFTIPNHVSAALGMKAGDPLRIALRADGIMVVVPMESELTASGGSLVQPRKLHVSMTEPGQPLKVIPEGRRIRAKSSFIRSTDGNRPGGTLRLAQ